MTWRKSSFSAPNRTEAVGGRDSKNPNGPVLTVEPSGWSALLRTLD